VASARPSRAARERESLEAILEAIGRDLELRPLLSRILSEACLLLGADEGTIGLVDAERDIVRTEAAYETPHDALGFEIPSGVGLTGAVLAARAPVHARRFADLPGAELRPWRAEHSVLGVPIRWGDEIIGVFGLGRAPRADSRRRPFTRRDEHSLAGFARYAAIAIENANRLALERHRLERSTLIARVGQLVSANLQLDDLLQRTADAVHELLGYENVAIPLIVEDGGEPTLHLRAFGGEYKRLIGGEHRLPIATGLMGAAASSGDTLLVNDVGSDPRYFPTPGVEGIRSELAVPIVLGARVLGVLNVESRQAFTEEDAAGLRVVAAQLAVAIENARLFDAAQQAAVLDERHRLARELHDAVTQQLFSASLVAQAVGPAYARDPEEGDRRAAMLVTLTRTALGEMRALLAELRPLRPSRADVPPAREEITLAQVRSDGLAAALRAYAGSPALAGLNVAVADGGYAPQDAEREETLFRIAQEALHNVVKHARATRAEVCIDASGDCVRLTVHDDGVGFTPAERTSANGAGARRDPGSGLGLRSMRERAATLGGTLRVARAPERGTLVEVAIPHARMVAQ
jgi:signal transduction histidine kinase